MKRCAITYSIDIALEKEGKQIKLTAFPGCIQNFFSHDENPMNYEGYETAILESEKRKLKDNKNYHEAGRSP